MNTSTSGQRKRSAAITGAGRGRGRDIARGLAAKGYGVFGTAMSSEEIADLKLASGGAVTLSQCDIRSQCLRRSRRCECLSPRVARGARAHCPGQYDIYKMDADGKAMEHWDTLQLVGDRKNSAPFIAPN